MIATERYKMTLPGYENVLVGKACVVSLRLRRSPHKRTPRLCGPPVHCDGTLALGQMSVSSFRKLSSAEINYMMYKGRKEMVLPIMQADGTFSNCGCTGSFAPDDCG